MSEIFIIISISCISIGLMILGLSITIIRKGRPMQTDVGENDEMKKLGLQCTASQFRQEENALKGEKNPTNVSCGTTCGSCSDTTEQNRCR